MLANTSSPFAEPGMRTVVSVSCGSCLETRSGSHGWWPGGGRQTARVRPLVSSPWWCLADRTAQDPWEGVPDLTPPAEAQTRPAPSRSAPAPGQRRCPARLPRSCARPTRPPGEKGSSRRARLPGWAAERRACLPAPAPVPRGRKQPWQPREQSR